MKTITDLNNINRSTNEGRLLFAAIAIITTESQTDKTPYQVLEKLEKLARTMDGIESEPTPQPELSKKTLIDEIFRDLENEIITEKQAHRRIIDVFEQLEPENTCLTCGKNIEGYGYCSKDCSDKAFVSEKKNRNEGI
jgi:hypothetical protein